jgi:nucleoside-diphosphate-sugar epimerase
VSTILVTGASGFIGSRIARALSDEHDVVRLSRRPVPGAGRSIVGAFHTPGDLEMLDDISFDAAIHLASEVGGCPEEAAFAVNVVGTQRLLRYLLDRGCRKVVLASSIAVVGCLHRSFVPRELPIREDHPCLSLDPYGVSKLMVEELARYFQRHFPDAEFVSFRIGPVLERYRPAGPVRAADREPRPFLELAWIRIGDVLAALKLAVTAPRQPRAAVYNLVGPRSYCADPVADVIRSSLGRRANGLDLSWFEAPERRYTPVYSLDAIREGLGFVPSESWEATPE